MAMREVKKFLWATPTKFAARVLSGAAVRGTARVRRASCFWRKLRGALDMQARCVEAGGEGQLLERGEMQENERERTCCAGSRGRVTAPVVGPLLLWNEEEGGFRRGSPRRAPRLEQPPDTRIILQS
jgi:hypothetical protein